MTVTGPAVTGMDFEPRTLMEYLRVLRAQMDAERSAFFPHWRELNDFILPRRGRFFITDTNKGERRTSKIIDSTATLAARTLSAGMMGGITSPARPWFRLGTPDPEPSEVGSVKEWLDLITRRMATIFLRSNLYNTLPIIYKDMGVFSIGCMFIEEDFTGDVIRTSAMPVGSYMIGNNDRGEVDSFIREFRMTTRQIVEMFAMQPDGTIRWGNISETVQDAWRKGQNETWFDIVHAIVPNPKYAPERLESRFKRYLSAYYERGTSVPGNVSYKHEIDNKFLRLSGYDLFPILAPRWELTGEDVYGTDGPGMTALGDIKQLQLGEKRSLQAIEKMVNPPMTGGSHLRSVKTTILSGDITYDDVRDGQKGFRPAHEVDPRIGELENKQAQVRARIRSSFYEDLFLMLASSDRREITAREVEERHEEKLLALGSVLERLNQDLLDPLIDITFDMMLRQGLIPEPPEEIQGVNLKVEYISIMAQAQKLVGVSGLERFMGFVAQLGQVPGQETVWDKVDVDQVIDEYGDSMGVPAKVIVPDEEVAEVRAQRAQQEQAARELQMVAEGAKAAKDLSQADLEKDSALKRLSDQAAAGQVA